MEEIAIIEKENCKLICVLDHFGSSILVTPHIMVNEVKMGN